MLSATIESGSLEVNNNSNNGNSINSSSNSTSINTHAARLAPVGRLNPLAEEWTPEADSGVYRENVYFKADVVEAFTQLPPQIPPSSVKRSSFIVDGYPSVSLSRKIRIHLPKPLQRPCKPNHGIKGTPIHVLTNFYQVDIPENLTVFQYDVHVVPETVTKVNRRVVDAFRDLLMRNSVALELGNWEWRGIYDGSKNLYSPSRLPFANDAIKCPVDLIDEDVGRRRVQKFMVYIRKTSEIRMSKSLSPGVDRHADSSTYVLDRQMDLPKEAIHVLEVLLRQRPGAIFTTIGRGGGSFYSEDHNTPIANALTVHQGLVSKCQAKPCATSFYVAGPLIETIAKYFNKPHIELTRSHLADPHERKRLERFLRDVTIEIAYRATGRKRYKIKALFDKPSAQTLIVTGTGEGRIKQIVPIAAYFQEVYGVVLQFPWLPCIVCGTKSDVVLPMEVCFVRRNQRHIGKLNDQQLADIVKLTAVLPEHRKERVVDGMRQLHGTGTTSVDPIVTSWGVQIHPQMSVIEGRILTPPPLSFGPSNNPSTSYRQVITPAEGTWRIGRNIRFAQPATLTTWAIAVFGDPQQFPIHVVSVFVKNILGACCSLGMEISERNLADVVVYAPMPQGGGRMSSDTIEATLRIANDRALKSASSPMASASGAMWEFDDLTGAGQSIGVGYGGGIGGGNHFGGGFGGMIGQPPASASSGPSVVAQMVICILAQKNTVYEQVKKIAETDIGLMTQCVIGKHVHTTKPSYSQNLALKINAKLGGINSFIDPLLELGGLADMQTMIMGADVTHPQYSSSDPSSIAALVGTIDAGFCEYRSSVRMQNTRREIISDLEGMSLELFEQFRQRNGCYPLRILFYRDGISEMQLQDVMTEEVSAIKRACASLGIVDVKLTFTVVNKRHHARFFPVRVEAGESDLKGNILAGTVVDSGVTHPQEFDFFLTSHPGMQGTSKAAHYHVLYDNNGFDADSLQEITYRLCYNFARSIVPPAYYAHLVAARARCYSSAQNIPHNHWHNNNPAAASPCAGHISNNNQSSGLGLGVRSFSNGMAGSPNLGPASPAMSNSGIYGSHHHQQPNRFGSSVNSNPSSSFMTNFASSRNHSRIARELPQVSPHLQGTMFFT
ncbi:Piwi domain-containing protein [Obelidium mucronatum]|nr:Piwi domain-containing protein [Obelidium mucronatum]